MSNISTLGGRLRVAFAMLLFTLFFSTSAYGAIAYVGSTSPVPASGTVSSVTFTAPAATAIGDFMLAEVAFQAGSSVTITASGWTLVARTNNGSTLSQAVYYRVATAAGAVSFTWNFSAFVRAEAAVITYSGVDAMTPINVSGGAASASSSSSIAAPSITTTVANTRLVGVFGTANGNAAITVPATLTKRTSAASGAGPNGVSAIMADAPQAAAAATGTLTATATTAALNVGQLIALNPAIVVTIPGRFNAFEPSTSPATAISGVIKTKIAGTAFLLDLIALDAAKTGLLATFTGAVKVELLNAQDNSGALDANNCRGTWATISGSSTTVTFIAADAGREKNASFQENNAWSDVRVRMIYPATGAPTAIGCSTDNFAIRPAKLTSIAVTDSNWEVAGTARSLVVGAAPPDIGGNVHKAGRPFSFSATATNALSTPSTTANYAGTPEANLIACLLPSGCSMSDLGSLDITAWTIPVSATGTVTTSTVSYSEAGAFTMQLEDRTFAAVDEADSTTIERYFSSAPFNLGRFVPDYFDVTTNNTPQFLTFNNPICATRSFTYIGQKFGYVTSLLPQILVTARNANANVTRNYANTLWKLTSSAATPLACSSSPDTCISTSGSMTQKYTYVLSPPVTPGWDSAQVSIGQPIVVVNNDGTGTVTVNSADAVAFARNPASLPQSSFSANISMALTVADGSEVSGTGISTATCTATPTSCSINTSATSESFNGAGSGIAFDSGNLFRFGVLKLSNAHGSESLNLPVPIEAQYWNGTIFVTNSADNCTTISATNISMDNYKKYLGACETAISVGGSLVAGRGNLQLIKPGAGNNGSVNLTVNLGSTAAGQTCAAPLPTAQQATTAANLSHLQGRWSGAAYNQNPAARATFGVYKGGPVIYIREMY